MCLTLYYTGYLKLCGHSWPQSQTITTKYYKSVTDTTTTNSTHSTQCIWPINPWNSIPTPLHTHTILLFNHGSSLQFTTTCPTEQWKFRLQTPTEMVPPVSIRCSRGAIFVFRFLSCSKTVFSEAHKWNEDIHWERRAEGPWSGDRDMDVGDHFNW